MSPPKDYATTLSARESELFPYVCAAMWGTAGTACVPSDDTQVEGCERVVDFMRFWLVEAAAIRRALTSGRSGG